MNKGFMKKVMPFLTIAAVFTFALVLFSPEEAAAAVKKAGITPEGNLKNSSIYNDLQDIVFFITAIGCIWALGCLIFGAMRLSGSGGNPQARTQGIISIVMAGVGIFVIVKANTIAGWFAGFGA